MVLQCSTLVSLTYTKSGYIFQEHSLWNTSWLCTFCIPCRNPLVSSSWLKTRTSKWYCCQMYSKNVFPHTAVFQLKLHITHSASTCQFVMSFQSCKQLIFFIFYHLLQVRFWYEFNTNKQPRPPDKTQPRISVPRMLGSVQQELINHSLYLYLYKDILKRHPQSLATSTV